MGFFRIFLGSRLMVARETSGSNLMILEVICYSFRIFVGVPGPKPEILVLETGSSGFGFLEVLVFLNLKFQFAFDSCVRSICHYAS